MRLRALVTRLRRLRALAFRLEVWGYTVHADRVWASVERTQRAVERERARQV